MAFKHKVQSLIDAGWLTFQEGSPNVRTNPFASHEGSAVNVVEEWEPQGLKKMGDLLTSRRFILEQGRFLFNAFGGTARCGDVLDGRRVATRDDG